MPSSPYRLPMLQNFIAGAFHPVEFSEDMLLDPSDGSLLGPLPRSSMPAIEAALQAADLCHRSRAWFGLGEKRADALIAIATAIEAHLDELAWIEALNTGVVIQQTRRLVGLVPLIFKAAAQQLLEHPDCQHLDPERRLELWHKPWGPVVCLAPWNSPAPIAAHKIASALAAGAPVILKPSELTPFSAQRLFEIIASCELPTGACQLVHGASAEGKRLISDRRVKAVSFTGGLAGGQAVGAVCMLDMKPVQLELGGHNPFIILPDASLSEVIDGLLFGLTRLNGQWCRAIGRIFVPDTLKDTILELFMQRLGSLRIGAATDPSSEMGPLIHRQHRTGIEQTIFDWQNQGARVHAAACALPEFGAYLAPQLLSGVDPTRDRHEIFGPVAFLHSYEDVAQLPSLVADSPFGLAAYIYGSDLEFMYRIARDLEVGSTKINGISMTSLSPQAPRAAWGLSGLGEEGNFETFRFFQGSTVLGTLHS